MDRALPCRREGRLEAQQRGQVDGHKDPLDAVYDLLYRAFKGQESGHYNFSATTFTLTKPNGEYALFLTRIDVQPFKKNVTAVEYVVIRNATTLADSYRIIADALQQVKSGSPKAWDIAHKELTHQAKLVEMEIPRYDEEARKVAAVADAVVWMLPGPNLLLHIQPPPNERSLLGCS